MPNRYIEFVRNYATENNIVWNCAVCQIKENNVYKPQDKNNKKKKRRTKMRF
jgi:hypothetical protein